MVLDRHGEGALTTKNRVIPPDCYPASLSVRTFVRTMRTPLRVSLKVQSVAQVEASLAPDSLTESEPILTKNPHKSYSG